MTAEEAIEQLKFDMEMILFDPSTGETYTPEQMKYINEDNYKTYLADQMAIAALEKQIKLAEWIENYEQRGCFEVDQNELISILEEFRLE